MHTRCRKQFSMSTFLQLLDGCVLRVCVYACCTARSCVYAAKSCMWYYCMYIWLGDHVFMYLCTDACMYACVYVCIVRCKIMYVRACVRVCVCVCVYHVHVYMRDLHVLQQRLIFKFNIGCWFAKKDDACFLPETILHEYLSPAAGWLCFSLKFSASAGQLSRCLHWLHLNFSRTLAYDLWEPVFFIFPCFRPLSSWFHRELQVPDPPWWSKHLDAQNFVHAELRPTMCENQFFLRYPMILSIFKLISSRASGSRPSLMIKIFLDAQNFVHAELRPMMCENQFFLGYSHDFVHFQANFIESFRFQTLLDDQNIVFPWCTKLKAAFEAVWPLFVR